MPRNDLCGSAAGAAGPALAARRVYEVYDRVRDALGDEHAIDGDEQARLVTAIVLHYQHGVPIEAAAERVGILLEQR